MVFELVISTDKDSHWIGRMSLEFPHSVSLIDMSNDDKGKVVNLVELKSGSVDTDRIKDMISGFKGFDSIRMSEKIEGKIIIVAGFEHCDICSAIMDSGCFLKYASVDGNRIKWKFLSPSKENARNLTSILEEKSISFVLNRLVPVEDSESLSSRQEEALKIALEGGYFDFPKRMGVREMAQEMNISSASVSEVLRRAMKNLVIDYFKEK
jgi:predicted DNA binding protein